MAQADLLNRKATTFWSIESTYGAGGGTPAQIWPVSFEGKRTRARVPVHDESVYFHDRKKSVFGLKRGAVSLALNTAAPAAQLLAASTPATSPNHVGLKAILGGESVAAGSLIATATSATQITVTAGQGGRFPPGTLLAVEQGGALHVTVVATQVGDVLTFAVALPGAPSVGGFVINLYNYYFSDTNVQSLEVRRAIVGDANEQHQYLGATGGLELVYEGPGRLLQERYQLDAADWNEGALGYATTYAANSQSEGFVLAGATTILQAVAATTRTHYPLHAMRVELRPQMAHLPEHGGVQGTTGVMRQGGQDDERAPATINLRIRADRDQIANWTSGADLRLLHIAPSGAGNTKRFSVVHAPNCYIDDLQESDEGGRRIYDLTLIPRMDTSGAAALARASIVLGRG